MHITWTTFLIVLPLTGLAGFVDAVAGGGGLISLPAYLIAGLPVHNAIATNKMSSGMGTALATYRYARNGYINWQRSILCVVAAVAGSSVGAHIALLIDDRIFKIIMLIILPLTAVYVMRGHAFSEDKEEFSNGKTVAIACLIALVIGAYDGFYGPGTGTFLILLLTGLAHFKLTEANGTSKVINLTTNITSFTVYLLNGKVILLLGLCAGLTNIIGAWFGTRLFDRVRTKAVRPIMILVLVLFFIRVITELI